MEAANDTLYYLNTVHENPGLSTAFQAATNDSDSMAVLFAAVFQQPSPYTPPASDPWGNAKVPIYEDLPQIASGVPTANVTVDPATAPYASYYGIPLAYYSGFLSSEYDGGYGGEWNFSMDASYLSLNCSSLDFMLWDDIAEQLLKKNEVLDDFPSTTGNSLWMNMTAPISITQPGNITFVSGCSNNRTDDGQLRYAFTICALQQTFVHSGVTCKDTNCTVVNISKLPDHQPTKMQNFMPEFLKASDTGLSLYPYIGNTTYSITELYLNDPLTATTPEAGETCDLNNTDITYNLAYLINSFWSTGFTHDYSTGALSNSSTVRVWNVSANEYQNYLLTTPTLDANDSYQSYETPLLYGVHWQWLGTYIACASVLMLIGIFGILLESKTIAPDILGFASSVARHSRYVKLPKVDGTMSGGERARLTRDCVVMMQDVRPDDPVGKIVLGSATPGAVRLSPTRSYK